MTSTWRWDRSPKTFIASSNPIEETDSGCRAISVSERTRLPAATALSKRRCMTARVDPDSRARLKRLPHLSEDFALPERERVETRGDAKEMARRVPSNAVEAGALELRLVQAAPLREIPRQPVADALVRREAVDLAAVAGRHDDSLGDHASLQETGQSLADLVGREGDALAHRHARSAKAPSEQSQPRFLRDAHRKTCCVER